MFRLSRVTGPVRATGPVGAVSRPPDVDLRAEVADSVPVSVVGTATLLVRKDAGHTLRRADGAQVVGSAILRGLGDTRLPMIFAGLGYWGIGLPLSAALGFLTPLAGRGIWIGLAIGLAVVSVMMLGRWMARERLGLVTTARAATF